MYKYLRENHNFYLFWVLDLIYKRIYHISYVILYIIDEI
jgi:hypothetical protein